jgi:hypothetical protein
MFYDLLSVKNMIWQKKNKFFGVKPILLIYSIYDESEKSDALVGRAYTSQILVIEGML